MMIVNACKCDKCNKTIESGFVVKGNIHTLDTETTDMAGGGLVGNNIQFVEDEEIITNYNHFCTDCMVTLLFGSDYEVAKKSGIREINMLG